MNAGEDLIASLSSDSGYNGPADDAVGRSEQMSHSNDTVESKSAWERCIAHLVVVGSALASTTVLLLQALPPLVHNLP
jgi:hypothetical protein